MKENKTEIVLIVDRSGSMQSVRNDAIGGFNSFIEEQKRVPGECLVTLCLFNSEVEIVHDAVPISDIPPLNRRTFVPDGYTALLDAVGNTVITIGERLARTPEEERPEHVVVAILTDGKENRSVEFRRDQVKKIIEHQIEKYSWKFIYLGQNVDSFSDARTIGIRADHDSTYVSNLLDGGKGQTLSYALCSSGIEALRRTKQINKALLKKVHEDNQSTDGATS